MHAADDDVVRIGYLPITDAAALLVAHAKGYFEEAGLKVAEPTPVRSWSALVEGFAAGKFNLAHLLKPIPVWMRYNNKFPVKVLAWPTPTAPASSSGAGAASPTLRPCRQAGRGSVLVLHAQRGAAIRTA